MYYDYCSHSRLGYCCFNLIRLIIIVIIIIIIITRLFHGTFLPPFNLHSYSIILFLLFQFRARGDHF